MFKKLIFFGLVGACVAPMYIKGPNGQPLMTIDDWIPRDTLASMGQAVEQTKALVQSEDSLQESAASALDTYYKWKDDKGVWQMTQVMPTHLDPSQVEIKTVNPNTNVVKSLSDAAIQAALNSGGAQHNKPKFVYNPSKPDETLLEEEEDKGFSLTTVSPNKIGQMKDTVQNLDQVMQQRTQALNNIK